MPQITTWKYGILKLALRRKRSLELVTDAVGCLVEKIFQSGIVLIGAPDRDIGMPVGSRRVFGWME